ncbi:hypothetical protein Pelo_550 [Pelomyxa schiedti]|nr:hypothetical protein Pelo_550 [Pelomyxa schiedti]
MEVEWVARFMGPTMPKKPNPAVKLFCFHHAGGNFNDYRKWEMWLPAEIQVCSIILPGHIGRNKEPLCLDLNELADVRPGDPICTVSSGFDATLHSIHNTLTKETHNIRGTFYPLGCNLYAVGTIFNTYNVFHTTNFSTPLLTVPCVRTFTGKKGNCAMKGRMHLRGGLIVWERCTPQAQESQTPNVMQYAITDAETDTLLGFVNFHKASGDFMT